jgi:endonuclease G
MKINKLLIYPAALIVLIAASCRKSDNGITPPTDTTTPVTPPAPTPYTIVEDFESGKAKSAYAWANVSLGTGVWTLKDALTGNLSASDAKNGARSVRFRDTSIEMTFDIAGVKKIKISHAKYGNDAASTWTLQMSTDGGTTYAQLGSPITETSTTLVTDSFTVSTTAAKARFKLVKTITTKQLRCNIDDFTFIGAGDPGITPGGGDTSTGDTDTGGSTGTPAAGRGVDVTGTDVPPTTGDNSNLLLGNPSGATTSVTVSANNYLMDQGYYIESYSSTKATPNWVCWHLDASSSTGVGTRKDNFAAWSGLPSGFYAVQSNSYSGSGFDRGHNCPSADRTSSQAANDATFLMTNMIPQAPQNNQQTWNNMESWLRTQAVAGNEVYIIMGNYGTGGSGSGGGTTNTINGGKVNVPSNVYKIAVIIPVGNNDLTRITTTSRIVAVNTQNINTISTDWKQYITSVKTIETATGYNFLSALPQNVQDALKVKIDSGN